MCVNRSSCYETRSCESLDVRGFVDGVAQVVARSIRPVAAGLEQNGRGDRMSVDSRACRYQQDRNDVDDGKSKGRRKGGRVVD